MPIATALPSPPSAAVSSGMPSHEEMVAAHYDSRADFGYIPTTFEVHHGEPALYDGEPFIALVDRMSIHLAASYITLGGLRYFRTMVNHEHGHPSLRYRAPGTVRNKLDDAKLAREKLGDKHLSAVWSLLNVVYDVIVETNNYDDLGPVVHDEVHLVLTARGKAIAEMVADPEAADKLAANPVNAFLFAYSEAIVGDPFTGLPIPPEVRTAAEAAVAIVRHPSFVGAEKVSRMLDVIIPLFLQGQSPLEELLKLLGLDGSGGGEGEDGEEEGEGKEGEGKEGEGKEGEGKEGEGKEGKKPAPGKKAKGLIGKSAKGLSEEDLKKLGEALEKVFGGKKASPSSEEAGENVVSVVLSQVDLDKPDEVFVAGSLLDIEHEELSLELLKAQAKRLLQFNVAGTRPGQSQQVRVASKPWSPGEALGALDIYETMRGYGDLIIPGVTTQQVLRYEYPGPAQPGLFPRLMVNADCSGSMTGDHKSRAATLLSIFAMIEQARLRGVPFAVDLFGDRHYALNWSRSYDKGMADIVANLSKTGGGNSVAGCETLPGKMQRGDLLVYITDFQLCGKQSQARQVLQQLLNMGVQIIFLCMFDYHDGDNAGIPYTHVRELADLGKASLKAITNKCRC